MGRRARHGDGAVLLQLSRVPARLHGRRRDGEVARHPELGLRRDHRLAAPRRAGGWRRSPSSSPSWRLQSGSNLNHDVGYLDFGMTGSFEQIVLADELIALNRRLFAGITVDAETLAADVIAEVGPGGHFMGTKHTRRHLRHVPVASGVAQPQGLRRLARGGRARRSRARPAQSARTARAHEPAPLPTGVAAEMDRSSRGSRPDSARPAGDGRGRRRTAREVPVGVTVPSSRPLSTAGGSSPQRAGPTRRCSSRSSPCGMWQR